MATLSNLSFLFRLFLICFLTGIQITAFASGTQNINERYRNLAKDKQASIPPGYSVFQVDSTAGLFKALSKIRALAGNGAILLADGTYHIGKSIHINIPNVMLMSSSANPEKVIIKGQGMRKSSRVENLIQVQSSGFVLDGIALQETGNHLIQIDGHMDTDNLVIRNCVMRDSYEQMIKVNWGNKQYPDIYPDSGLIEYCRFEYTNGIGPNYYIGGIDAHGVRGWTIRYNLFKDIASPGLRISEFAIHLWTNASNNLVEGNIIIDCDRGIGFGMLQKHPNISYGNLGGMIKNNLIYHSDNGDQFADVAISLEDSPASIVRQNIIYMEHTYPNSIEYRFPGTKNLVIEHNRSNKSVQSRNGALASLKDNTLNFTKTEFNQIYHQRRKEIGLND